MNKLRNIIEKIIIGGCKEGSNLCGQTIWLPTDRLETEMSSKTAERLFLKRVVSLSMQFRPKQFEMSELPSRIIPSLRASRDGPTVKFILQISKGIEPFETDLWFEINRGFKCYRELLINHCFEKTLLDKHSFLHYADTIRRGLDFTKKNGILPTETKAGPNSHNVQKKDFNIGFAIVNNQIYFYRTGHHRLGYALACGIQSVPCSLLLHDNCIKNLDIEKKGDIVNNTTRIFLW